MCWRLYYVDVGCHAYAHVLNCVDVSVFGCTVVVVAVVGSCGHGGVDATVDAGFDNDGVISI